MNVERDVAGRVAVARGGASPAETVAIVAAVERFIRDTASAARETPGGGDSAWLSSARLEAIERWPSAARQWGAQVPLQ